MIRKIRQQRFYVAYASETLPLRIAILLALLSAICFLLGRIGFLPSLAGALPGIGAILSVLFLYKTL